jgi:hypothetical protein
MAPWKLPKQLPLTRKTLHQSGTEVGARPGAEAEREHATGIPVYLSGAKWQGESEGFEPSRPD